MENFEFYFEGTLMSFEYLSQPIVNPAGIVEYYEVLSRMSDDIGAPADYEDFFNKVDSDFVKKLFVDQFHCFSLNLTYKNLCFGYNLFLSHLRDVQLVEFILTHSASRVYIEVSRFDCVIDAILHRNIGLLQRNNVYVVFDDFDYHILGHNNYLRHLPWDSVKIDRSYLLEATKMDYIDLLIDYLKCSTKQVIVEGVETYTQLQMLKPFEILSQGYFFSYGLTCTELNEICLSNETADPTPIQ